MLDAPGNWSEVGVMLTFLALAHVEMLDAASRRAAIGRHFSLCLLLDLLLHPSWCSFQSSLRIVLCCTASQTNVASAVLRLLLAPTSRKAASPDPGERHPPSQYQEKQTQGLEDLQYGLSRANLRIYAAQHWSCSYTAGLQQFPS